MNSINDKYIIDRDKLSLLRIKLILECSKIVHHLGEDVNPIIKATFIKNYASSYIIENGKLKTKDNELVHKFEYDEYSKSQLVREIEKILNNDFTTINNISVNICNEKEKKYYQEISDSIIIKDDSKVLEKRRENEK